LGWALLIFAYEGGRPRCGADPAAGWATNGQPPSEDFDEVLARQAGHGGAFVEEDAAGLAGRPPLVAGLLQLEVFTDAGLAHGGLHANGVMLFESTTLRGPNCLQLPVSFFLSQCGHRIITHDFS